MKNTELQTQKHLDAIERADLWQSLTPVEQLTRLDTRLGIGVGARKQRAKIAKAMGD